MSYSIYDKFLTIQSCNYYSKQIANKLCMNMFTYYYDNIDKIQIPGDEVHDICDWLGLDVPNWRRTFNLCNANKIKKIGIENYIKDKRELNFYLTVKGYSIIYAIKFMDIKQILKPKVINSPQDNILDDYILESDGQLAFRF